MRKTKQNKIMNSYAFKMLSTYENKENMCMNVCVCTKICFSIVVKVVSENSKPKPKE